MSAIAPRLTSAAAALLLLAVSGCDVKVTDCNKSDAAICDFTDDVSDGGEDDASDSDAATSGSDGGTADAAAGDGSTGGNLDGSTTDDAGGDTPDAAAPFTIEEFCAAQLSSATAWRDALYDRCFVRSPPMNREQAAQSAFLSAVLLYADDDAIGACVRNQTTLTAPGGKVSYDATKAAACATAIAAQYDEPPQTFPAQGADLGTAEGTIGHGAAANVQLPACRATFVGSSKLGATCSSSFECADGLRCRTQSADLKTCQAAVTTENGPCTLASDCADNLRCVGDPAGSGKTCVAKDNLPIGGGRCASSRECISGYVCTSNVCVAAKPSFICPT
jgi:hypothetical protein